MREFWGVRSHLLREVLGSAIAILNLRQCDRDYNTYRPKILRS
ncbi:MAG: hypothetical protein AAGA60_18180 [Cyanobacteria bacterium P01_E01_bin.42]